MAWAKPKQQRGPSKLAGKGNPKVARVGGKKRDGAEDGEKAAYLVELNRQAEEASRVLEREKAALKALKLEEEQEERTRRARGRAHAHPDSYKGPRDVGGFVSREGGGEGRPPHPSPLVQRDAIPGLPPDPNPPMHVDPSNVPGLGPDVIARPSYVDRASVPGLEQQGRDIGGGRGGGGRRGQRPSEPHVPTASHAVRRRGGGGGGDGGAGGAQPHEGRLQARERERMIREKDINQQRFPSSRNPPKHEKRAYYRMPGNNHNNVPSDESEAGEYSSYHTSDNDSEISESEFVNHKMRRGREKVKHDAKGVAKRQLRVITEEMENAAYATESEPGTPEMRTPIREPAISFSEMERREEAARAKIAMPSPGIAALGTPASASSPAEGRKFMGALMELKAGPSQMQLERQNLIKEQLKADLEAQIEERRLKKEKEKAELRAREMKEEEDARRYQERLDMLREKSPDTRARNRARAESVEEVPAGVSQRQAAARDSNFNRKEEAPVGMSARPSIRRKEGNMNNQEAEHEAAIHTRHHKHNVAPPRDAEVVSAVSNTIRRDVADLRAEHERVVREMSLLQKAAAEALEERDVTKSEMEEMKREMDEKVRYAAEDAAAAAAARAAEDAVQNMSVVSANYAPNQFMIDSKLVPVEMNFIPDEGYLSRLAVRSAQFSAASPSPDSSRVEAEREQYQEIIVERSRGKLPPSRIPAPPGVKTTNRAAAPKAKAKVNAGRPGEKLKRTGPAQRKVDRDPPLYPNEVFKQSLRPGEGDGRGASRRLWNP